MTDITVSEAIVLSLLGIAMVFAILIVLMFIIMIMSKIVVSLDKPKKEETTVSTSQSTPEKTGTPAPGSCGALKLVNVSEADAAMIMAIVADEMKTPLNELRFKSIAAVDEN